MSMMTGLDDGIRFDEERHVYTRNGYRLPSVTSIMRPMSQLIYGDVDDYVLQIAADRGSRVHEQISNNTLYGIWEEDEDTKPYIEAFRKFRQDYHDPLFTGSEVRAYHKTMGYAGTIDLVGFVTPDDGKGLDVVDIKTTTVLHPVLLETQLGAYAEMLKSHGDKIRSLYGLQLKKDGTYRLEKLKNGYGNFLHCYAIWSAIQPELIKK